MNTILKTKLSTIHKSVGSGLPVYKKYSKSLVLMWDKKKWARSYVGTGLGWGLAGVQYVDGIKQYSTPPVANRLFSGSVIEDGYLKDETITNTVQQVKASGFSGAGSATVAGLLTTDTITATGIVPTCTVDGTLTFGGDCWDVYVHRGGVLWAYWPAINVGKTTELDASGNGNHLTDLTTAVITEYTDGSGSDYCNFVGFQVANKEAPQYTDFLDDVYPDYTPSGDTYYVRADGTAITLGTATSAENPETSINKTVFRTLYTGVNPGDVIVISGHGGDYNGEFNAMAGGTMGNPVTYMGDPSSIPNIDQFICNSSYINVIDIFSDYADVDSPLLINSDYYRNTTTDLVGIKTYNYKAMQSTNQGVQHMGSNLVEVQHFNIFCLNCLDEGISAHDSAVVVVDGGAIKDCTSGIASGDGTSSVVLNDVHISGVSLTGWPVDPQDLGSVNVELNRCIVIDDDTATDFRMDFTSGSISFDSCEFYGLHGDYYLLLRETLDYANCTNCLFINATLSVAHAPIFNRLDGMNYSGNTFFLADTMLGGLGRGEGDTTNTKVYTLLERTPINDECENLTSYIAPLGRDFQVTSGTTIADATVKAPLGAMFQGIPEWSGEAELKLLPQNTEEHTRIGDKLTVYDIDSDIDLIPAITDNGLGCYPAYSNGMSTGSEDFQTGSWASRGGANPVQNTDGSYRVTLGAQGVKDLYNTTGQTGVHVISLEAKLVSGASQLKFLDAGTGIGELKMLTSEFEVYSIVSPTQANSHHLASADANEVTVDIRFPMVVENTSYLLPYIPPGTSVTSSVGTVAGNGAYFEMDEATLEAFGGKTDGVELWDGTLDTSFRAVAIPTVDSLEITVADGSSNGGAGVYLQKDLLQVTCIATIPPGGGKIVFQDNITYSILDSIVLSSGVTDVDTIIKGVSGNGIRVLFYITLSNQVGVYSDISIQDYIPATCTLATVATMGVGSDELLGTTDTKNIIYCGGDINFHYYRGTSTDEQFSVKVVSTDGVSYSQLIGTWDRYNQILRITQTNPENTPEEGDYAGKYFRVGYKNITQGDTDYTFSGWTIFDGSFDPLDYLRFALDSTVPIEMGHVQVWNEYVDTSVVDKELAKYGWL